MGLNDLLIVVPQADTCQPEEGFIAGMFRTNINCLIALLPVWVCVAIELNFIHAFLGVKQAAFRALNLISQPELASHADTAGTNCPDGTILKTDEELHDVFIFDSSLLTTALCRGCIARTAGWPGSLFNFRSTQPANLNNIADQKMSEGNGMRA